MVTFDISTWQRSKGVVITVLILESVSILEFYFVLDLNIDILINFKHKMFVLNGHSLQRHTYGSEEPAIVLPKNFNNVKHKCWLLGHRVSRIYNTPVGPVTSTCVSQCRSSFGSTISRLKESAQARPKSMYVCSPSRTSMIANKCGKN